MGEMVKTCKDCTVSADIGSDGNIYVHHVILCERHASVDELEEKQKELVGTELRRSQMLTIKFSDCMLLVLLLVTTFGGPKHSYPWWAWVLAILTTICLVFERKK